LSLALREVYRLRIFENRAWGVEEYIRAWEGRATGDWRKLHNKEIYNLYYSSPTLLRMTK